MNLDQIYDGWDLTDDDSPIQTCCRVRSADGVTALVAAISKAPFEVVPDVGVIVRHLWHEIEYHDRPARRFSREHAVIVNLTGAEISADNLMDNLMAMQAVMFRQWANIGRITARLITLDGEVLIGMYWPPIAVPVNNGKQGSTGPVAN